MNLLNVVKQASANGILAFGNDDRSDHGGIDLSMGSIVRFFGRSVRRCFAHPGEYPLIVSCADCTAVQGCVWDDQRRWRLTGTASIL